MKSFITYIEESVIDLPRNSLDPDVFMFQDGQQPILNPAIKRQIVENIHEIEGACRLKDFYMVGSILTKTYTHDSDIDITIEVEKGDVDDITEVNLLTVIKRLNGRLAISTTHPINYYFELTDEPIDYRFDAIYDVINERWRKEPKHFHINIEDYVKKFQDVVSTLDLTTAALRRDIIDIQELSKFSKKEIGNIKEILQSKLYEVSQKVEELIDKKKYIKKSRVQAFSKPWTPEEIAKFKSKNAMPENVIFKLLQKYYYWEFIQKLETILGDKENIDLDDVKDIKKAEQDFYSESYKNDAKSSSDVIFGLIDFGRTILKRGTKKDDHESLKLASPYGTHFRYLPSSKTIYWWGTPKPSEVSSAIFKLKGFGYTVEHPNVSLLTPAGDTDKVVYKQTHESFEAFSNNEVLEEKIKKIKLPKVDWKSAQKRKQYAKSHGSLAYRGADRKDMRQIPEYRRNVGAGVGKSAGNIASAKRSIDLAKKAPSGLWRLTPMQVKWVATKYHHIPPNDKVPIKHLGNTGIMVWKRGDKYYLVKHHRKIMH